MCQRLTLEQFGFVLALFSHRRLPPFEFTSHYAFAPRPTSRVRSCTDPPAGYCLTPTAELAKTERGPISRSGPSIFSMSPNQAIPTEKLIRFFPTRRHPIVDHSLVPRGAQRQWLQACVPDGHQPQCMFSLYPPYTPDEFTRVGLVLHHTSQDFLSPPQILL